MSSLSTQTIADHFNQAADTYDAAASVQAQVARRLVEKAIRATSKAPSSVLDIGCGTGFVGTEVMREWPWTSITALDNAPAMCEIAQSKIPQMRVITSDMTTRDFGPSFDLIFSSMALHWLDDPAAALERWRRWLRPGGHLFAALPVAGSFTQWQQLCYGHKVASGLWAFPEAHFVNRLAVKSETEQLVVAYPSALGFLRQIKATGAATPRPDYRPIALPKMRQMLAAAPQPFTITYLLLYLEMQSPDSI